MIAGFGLSIPAIAWGLYLNELGGWSYAEAFFLNGQFNYWGSVLMALGYIGLVMLWCLGDTLPALRARLAAVGRTAFSCYIAQSLICTFVFYGHGLGLYGSVGYAQQALVVFAVWALLLSLGMLNEGRPQARAFEFLRLLVLVPGILLTLHVTGTGVPELAWIAAAVYMLASSAWLLLANAQQLVHIKQ